jgi:putative restriction endonuclease
LVLNTDFDWYSYLRGRPDLEEVNFWLPSGRGLPRSPLGTPVFFKLKRPHYAIGGFGYLVHASRLPAWLAWERYREANGAQSFPEMRERIEKYRRLATDDPLGRYEIGCLMISLPTFFEEKDWVRSPKDWSREIVRGKSYNLGQGEGERIWMDCLARTGEGRLVGGEVARSAERYGKPALVRPRLGQESFRIAVLDAYGRACAVCQEHSLPALEAAHIRPYSEGGEHAISNGLLLRLDIHRLFDKGYVTVSPDHRFLVSHRLKQDFSNGRSYVEYDGRRVHLPKKAGYAPDPGLLEWHNNVKFLR